ncbi:GDSL-like lipase/acylhydrolase family protein [Asanoa ferruginea]|uniref:GDSL-like lipase/acylhydrolase family protein n=1 Tax=Asanoa ferruginea TaxID=53367 RepID=A0A3D9ZQJ9_9ACTN|nr:SGNH/GDSL hydrolase family protein [Asanoa ferruginea]REF99447.1 GDSL-like lipase/acylhydrolase family protein [Asanoa ferruginea]GIF49379.1 hypothetical protein Afe04nite_39180 [Asanoa ferruginea]
MRTSLAAAAALLCAAALLVAPAASAAEPPNAGATAPAEPSPDRVPTPDKTLASGWRRSPDRAVTTSSDETGLHVLVANANQAYRWRTVATLAEPGFETDQWIGQLCVTGSGRRAVVVYAPRQFVNHEESMRAGGFAAVVDLADGTVTKLAERVSLAYYNPGCGTSETAVLSRLEATGAGPASTWLGTVDAARATVRAVRAVGQVTSALPYRSGLAGVKGDALVSIGGNGAVSELARTSGSPHRLMADGTGALAFQVKHGNDIQLSRYAAGKVSTVATVPPGTVRLRPGAGGHVYAIGGKARERTAGRLPSGWRAVDAEPDSEPSTTGALVVTGSATGREAAAGTPGVSRGQDAESGEGAERVQISAELASGAKVDFSVKPTVTGAGRVLSPAGRQPAGERSGARLSAPDYSTVPYDPDRTCAVPRNDPEIQVYQPTPAQVEWAADLAVRGQLTFQRAGNWANNGLPAYSPQGLFPSLPLVGGGSVPAQVLLGILAQESNLWQASFHVVDGSAGNPLTSSGYYGIEASGQADPRDIDWSHADCGYGVGQVTTGMRAADTGTTAAGITWDATKQKAVALDYATNVSAALRILQDKWNQTRSAGLVANNGDPGYIENWWFAIWAYNTGFYPQSGGAPWGVGWANNVANQDYPADRQMFLTAPLDVPAHDGQPAVDDDIGYDNAKHPNHWSYPERVVGFAYTSVRRFDYGSQSWEPTYTPALNRGTFFSQPGRFTFCAPSVNECDPAAQHVPGDFPGTAAGACLRDDLMCKWHGPVTWVDCSISCGVERRVYTSVEPRPFADNMYATPVNADGTCSLHGLPSGSKIVDDINTEFALGPEGCTPTFNRTGSFDWTFGSMTGVQGQPIYPSKVDLHQIGGGFGGHFWFAHTMSGDGGNAPLKITGTWTVGPVNAWTRVFVHVPDHGAHTRQADYKVYLPGQATSNHHRAIPTRWEANKWLDIGVFDFRGNGNARIQLSNVTADGAFLEDIAWDAVAVQPLTAEPRHFVVALGDSISSGEGVGNYARVSDQYAGSSAKDGCKRSPGAWSRGVSIPGTPGLGSIGDLDDAFQPNVDFHHIACAGARTHNVMATRTMSGAPAPRAASMELPGPMDDRELAQLDQGFLDENTTLALLTVGANDTRWADIVKACAFHDCLDGYRLDGDTAPVTEATETRLRGSIKTDVRRVLQEVRERAPNAVIVLAGYPQLFRDGTTYDLNPFPGVAIGITADEVDWLNEMSGVATAELIYDDYGPGIYGVDVTDDFASHELGTVDSNENWLNGWIAGDLFRPDDDDSEPNDSNTGAGSFHPNAAGYRAYANAVGALLATVNYRW